MDTNINSCCRANHYGLDAIAQLRIGREIRLALECEQAKHMLPDSAQDCH